MSPATLARQIADQAMTRTLSPGGPGSGSVGTAPGNYWNCTVTRTKLAAMANDCFICRKQASGDALGAGVIYEDDMVFASHTMPTDGKADAYLGLSFVETKRHVAGLGQLTNQEAAALGVLVNDLGAALRSTEGVEHVYAHVYGDGVPHLHVHLQPRYPQHSA